MIDERLRSSRVQLRHLAAFCLDVLFPPVCAGCGRLGSLLCQACAARMKRVSGPICERCGRSLAQKAEICPDCAMDSFRLRQMRAPLRYEEPTSRLIHRLKYEGCFALAEPLAHFLIAGWPAWDQPPDLILPIPLHSRRKRRRGYNQSELLARPLARALELPFSAEALQRIRHTASQVGLGVAARAENVRDAFSAAPAVVRARHVLLIDDVLTTGATMSAAAQALLAAGAADVSGYCLARVS